MTVLELLEMAIVHVPSAVAGIFDRLDMTAPIDLDEAHPGLDQPTSEQATLAESISAVPITHLGGLTRRSNTRRDVSEVNSENA